MTDPISIRQAYIAMFRFLEIYYDRTHADEIGALLGGMAIDEDGSPRIRPRGVTGSLPCTRWRPKTDTRPLTTRLARCSLGFVARLATAVSVTVAIAAFVIGNARQPRWRRLRRRVTTTTCGEHLLKRLTRSV